MKSVILLVLLVAAAALAAPSSDKDATILRYNNDNIGLEGYNYGYETSNGISVQEVGKLEDAGSEKEALVVKGSYSYTGPDGVEIAVVYTADENGFQPQGAHLPVAP